MKGAKSQSQKDLEDFAKIDNLDLTKIAKLDGKDFSLSGYRRKARTKPYLIQDLKNGGSTSSLRKQPKDILERKLMKQKPKQPKPRNPMFVRKATMTINDKREKVAKRRHQHEIFQAKLLRKELKNEE